MKRARSDDTDDTQPAKRMRLDERQNRLMRKAGFVDDGALSSSSARVPGDDARVGTAGLGHFAEVKRTVHEYKEVATDLPKMEWFVTQADTKLPGSFVATDDAGPLEPMNPEFETLKAELDAARSAFDSVDPSIFHAARDRGNPYEMVKSCGFNNRAAVKLAELHAMCDFKLVAERAEGRPFYFGDVCAGPGGFSEFILTVLKWKAKGFGMTLRPPRGRSDIKDFELHKFNRSAPTRTFWSTYGADGTGDVYNPANIEAYVDAVDRGTQGHGLDLLVGDGGFSVQGEENQQEALTERLIHCQCTLALGTLAVGGVYVVKLFDTFEPYTVQLLALMQLHFERVALPKPAQSRPANSERYLVCWGLRTQRKPPAYRHLLNRAAHGLRRWPAVVSLFEPGDDSDAFLLHLHVRTVELARAQTAALKRLMQYVQDASLQSDDQAAVRDKCVAAWGLGTRVAVDTTFGRYLESQSTEGRARMVAQIDADLRRWSARHSDTQGAQGLLVQRVPKTWDRAALFVESKRALLYSLRFGWTEWKGPRLSLPVDTIADVALDTKASCVHVLDAWLMPSSTAAHGTKSVDRVDYRLTFRERVPLLRAMVAALHDSSVCFVEPSSAMPDGGDLDYTIIEADVRPRSAARVWCAPWRGSKLPVPSKIPPPIKP